MKLNKNINLLRQYSGYFQYGAVALLTTWLLALLTATFSTGPYYFDFFGVVSERSTQESTVTIGWEAFLTAFIFLPIVIALVDFLNKKKRK